MKKHLACSILFVFCSLLVNSASSAVGVDSLLPVPDEIRREATLPNDSELGKPLPLSAHWNTGERKNSISPAYQMQLIEKGHYLLPCFKLVVTDTQPPDSYYEAAIKRAAQMKLPISFVSTQWESLLTTDPTYFNYPIEDNPNVVDSNGQVLKKVSPFGAVSPWRDVGMKWTTSSTIKKLQEWYPDPPVVVFISNNEHSKLQWKDVDTDRRYVALYGSGKDDNFKRRVVGEGWIVHYRALQEGMRGGLILQKWKDGALFVGYGAFGLSAFARWNGWINYSLYFPGRIDPWPLAWDGGSASYYVNSWNDSTDYKVWSPQIQSMNWVFMEKEAYHLNPRFWFEISTWGGQASAKENDKVKYYASLGQTYTPERYGGMVQFGMWLLRPRVVRELSDWTGALADVEPYFLAIVKAVDSVHNNPILRKFWRYGELVANTAQQHPYQKAVPNDYKEAARWFLLNTDVDPPRPWGLTTELPVFSLALVMGTPPKREWLVYAHSPLMVRTKVKVFIPSCGPVLLDSSPAGGFYLVQEKDKVATPVNQITAPSTLRIIK